MGHNRLLVGTSITVKARPFYATIGMIYTGWWLRSRWQFCVCRCKIGGPFLRHGPLPRSLRYVGKVDSVCLRGSETLVRPISECASFANGAEKLSIATYSISSGESV